MSSRTRLPRMIPYTFCGPGAKRDCLIDLSNLLPEPAPPACDSPDEPQLRLSRRQMLKAGLLGLSASGVALSRTAPAYAQNPVAWNFYQIKPQLAPGYAKQYFLPAFQSYLSMQEFSDWAAPAARPFVEKYRTCNFVEFSSKIRQPGTVVQSSAANQGHNKSRDNFWLPEELQVETHTHRAYGLDLGIQKTILEIDLNAVLMVQSWHEFKDKNAKYRPLKSNVYPAGLRDKKWQQIAAYERDLKEANHMYRNRKLGDVAFQDHEVDYATTLRDANRNEYTGFMIKTGPTFLIVPRTKSETGR